MGQVCDVIVNVRVVSRNTLKQQKAISGYYLIFDLCGIVPDYISNMLIQLCDI